MRGEPQKTPVLITVMTYPHPSRGHREVVCTAGITDSLEWVRLYPIGYRYGPSHQRVRKYQWVEVGLTRAEAWGRFWVPVDMSGERRW